VLQILWGENVCLRCTCSSSCRGSKFHKQAAETHESLEGQCFEVTEGVDRWMNKIESTPMKQAGYELQTQRSGWIDEQDWVHSHEVCICYCGKQMPFFLAKLAGLSVHQALKISHNALPTDYIFWHQRKQLGMPCCKEGTEHLPWVTA
jgi:hypothetical protein